MRTNSMTHTRLLSVLLATALLPVLTACSQESAGPVAEPDAKSASAGPSKNHTAGEAEHGEEGDEEEGPASVTMDAAALKAAGIRLEVLKPSSPAEQLRAPGEVLDSAYGTTLITPRVAALVVRRHAKLGDEVRGGAPLVTLAAVEVSDAQADLRIAEQEWRRVSALGREAVAGRRINEAKIAVDRARAKAQAYGLPGTSSGNVNGQFTLSAPHAGRLTEDNFVVGERIEPGRALFRLVDESVVWVDAKLPSGIVPRLKSGSPAMIVANGQRIPGKVLRAAHRTSETTRSAMVRIEVPNKDDLLHGGDFVDVYLDADAGSGPAQQLAVPTQALVQIEGDTVVFRRNAAGALKPVQVRPGDVIGEVTVITDGLKAGDTVVVEGAFALKAQILKAQMGDGHGH